MYENIGEKIKGLAVIGSLIVIVFSILAGMSLISSDRTTLGVIILIAVPLVTYLSSWLLYGFGELISTANSILYTLQNNNEYDAPEVPTATTDVINNRLHMIETLIARELIAKEGNRIPQDKSINEL